MSFTQPFRGGTTDTGTYPFCDYDNVYAYDTISWPGGSPNRDGSLVCIVDGINVVHGSGIINQTVTSDGYVRIYCGTARMNACRNPAVGGSIPLSNGASFGGTGGLVGWFTWYTVPTAPGALSLARAGRDVTVTCAGASGSNGGQSITGYKVQRRGSTDGGVTWGAWGNEQDISSMSYVYVGLPVSVTYQFRAYAQNAGGNSAAAVSANQLVPASGKRRVSGTYQELTIGKRKVAGVWVDLTIGKRKVGGSWVDLS